MFRNLLKARLIAQNSKHNLEESFKVDDIYKVVENLLKRDCFNTEHIPSNKDKALDDKSSNSNSNLSEDSDALVSKSYKKKKHGRSGSKGLKEKGKVAFEHKEVDAVSNSDFDVLSGMIRK